MPIGFRTMEADEEEAVEPDDVIISRLSTLAESASGLYICSGLFRASAGKLYGKGSGLAARSAFSTSRSTMSMGSQVAR